MIILPLSAYPSKPSNLIQLTVNLLAPTHPISPLIYGMNDNNGEVDPKFAKEIRLPVSRWGGDATSRYNWVNDGTNSGADWFFMAGPPKPGSIPGASSDAFIMRAKAAGGIALLTIPIIDYINRSTTVDCSFPVSIFGPQQEVNPYVKPLVEGRQTEAGNGRRINGDPIVLSEDQILRVNQPNSRSFQESWLKHLVGKFGIAAKGGVAVYQMDNEPSGWSNTHRDIHPMTPTYAEILEKTIWYANQIKQVDPTAKVLGPGDFGWPAYRGNPEKQGGLWNAELYLQQMQVASNRSETRLLDFFDEHYYPVQDDGGEAISNAPAGSQITQRARLNATRSLWDSTYIENNWIGKYNGPIRLIPRMREWVAKFYPGTKTSITEYNFGGLESINGSLCEADILGIFGREKLDLATLWGPPKPNQPGAFAFRMYRNYDGLGGKFGDSSLDSKSSDESQVSVFSARRSSDLAITVMLINKSGKSKTVELNLSGCKMPEAQIFRYSPANLAAIKPGGFAKVKDSKIEVILPTDSINLLVLK